jgi:hypothetical protein
MYIKKTYQYLLPGSINRSQAAQQRQRRRGCVTGHRVERSQADQRAVLAIALVDSMICH